VKAGTLNSGHHDAQATDRNSIYIRTYIYMYSVYVYVGWQRRNYVCLRGQCRQQRQQQQQTQ